MGIEFDAASTSQSFADFREWAHPIGSGAFRIILAGGATNALGPTTATYDGAAMDLIATFNNPGGAQCRMWYLLDPPAGAANVRINFGGNGSLTCGAVSYEGVDPNNPIGTPATAQADSTAPSVAVTSGEGELVVDFMGFRAGSTNMTAGAGQTERVDNNSAAGDNTGAGMSEEAGDSSVTMSWTLNNSGGWAICGVPLKPFISERDRLIKYWASTLDPKGRIFDNTGRVIPASLVEYDNWFRNEGPYFFTPRKHTSLVEADPIGYLEAIKFNEDGRTQFITETETLLESLFRRLGARGA